jgi:hypothetical protein
MKRILNKIIPLLLLTPLSCVPAMAAVTFSTSVMYTKINDPAYKFTNEAEQLKLTSLTLGYFKELKNNISVGAYTNRFLNKGLKRQVTANTTLFTNRTKTTFDAVQLGYRINRVMPNIFIANTEVDKKLYYQGSLVGRQTNHIYTYGAGLNYYLDKKATVGLTYILPVEEINMEGGLALSINFLL